VLALDFGAGTTSLALFVVGHLLANDVIAVGGNHISFDLARAFATSLAEAERIKALYGTLQVAAADAEQPVAFTGAGEEGERLQTTTGKVSEVIKSRLTGLLGQIAERVERAGVSLSAIERLVVTGGAGQLAGLSDFASAYWRKPVRAGQPRASYGWPATSCSPALSTVLGLSQVAFDPTAGVRRRERNFQGGGYLRSVGRWLQASF